MLFVCTLHTLCKLVHHVSGEKCQWEGKIWHFTFGLTDSNIISIQILPSDHVYSAWLINLCVFTSFILISWIIPHYLRKRSSEWHMRIGRNLIQPFPKFSTYEGPCNSAIKRTSELLIFREKTSRIKTKWNDVNNIYKNSHHGSTQLLISVNCVSFCLN